VRDSTDGWKGVCVGRLAWLTSCETLPLLSLMVARWPALTLSRSIRAGKDRELTEVGTPRYSAVLSIDRRRNIQQLGIPLSQYSLVRAERVVRCHEPGRLLLTDPFGARVSHSPIS